MEIVVENPAPTLITVRDLITEETAAYLRDCVDKRGKDTAYNGNPSTREFRLGGFEQMGFMGVGGAEDARDMHTISVLEEVIRPLKDQIEIAYKNTALEKILGHRGFWVMRYGEGGAFDEHVDWSLENDENSTPAVATMCINIGGDYEGGQKSVGGQRVFAPYLGAEIHDGWTFHSVNPVTRGNRYIVCVHFLGTLKS